MCFRHFILFRLLAYNETFWNIKQPSFPLQHTDALRSSQRFFGFGPSMHCDRARMGMIFTSLQIGVRLFAASRRMRRVLGRVGCSAWYSNASVGGRSSLL